MVLDELNGEGRLAHSTTAYNDELVLSQDLGLELAYGGTTYHRNMLHLRSPSISSDKT